MSRRIAAASLMVLIVPGVALAKTKPPVFVTAAPVKDKPAVTLDRAQAYVMLRSEAQMPLMLMRVPDEADQAAYTGLRAAALVEARGKYVKKLAGYERTLKQIRDWKPGGVARPETPERPIEPTEENFQFTPFGLMANAAIGPINRFAKADKMSTYLHALTPGRYRIYGPIAAMPNGAMTGVCFCMGSVSFEAKAGEITDLGFVPTLPASEQPAEPAEWLRPTPAGLAVDPRLAGTTIRPAQFQAVGKLPNYYGLQIMRMPAMAGVLRYDRDRVVAP